MKAIWPRKNMPMKKWFYRVIQSCKELILHSGPKLDLDLTLLPNNRNWVTASKNWKAWFSNLPHLGSRCEGCLPYCFPVGHIHLCMHNSCHEDLKNSFDLLKQLWLFPFIAIIMTFIGRPVPPSSSSSQTTCTAAFSSRSQQATRTLRIDYISKSIINKTFFRSKQAALVYIQANLK